MTKKTPLNGFIDGLQRWLMLAMLASVILWLSVDTTNSTIVKPELLIGFASIIAVAGLTRSIFEGTIAWNRTPADLPVFLFLISGGISLAFSDYSAFGIVPFLLSLSYGVCLISGTNLFPEKRHFQFLIDSLLVISAIVCLFGLYQAADSGFLGIKVRSDSSRLVSTLGNATYLGGYLTLMIPVAVGRLISNKERRWLIGPLIALMAVVLFLTETRSSLAAATAATALLIIMVRTRGISRTTYCIGILLALLITLLFLIPGIGQNLPGIGSDISYARRTYFWKAAAASVLEAPLLGHGPGSHAFVIPRFREPDYWMTGSEDIVEHSHNEFLETAVENGIIGLVMYGVFIGVVLWNGIGSVQSPRQWERVTGLSLLCAVVGIIAENLIGVTLRQPPVAMIAWLFAGLLLSPSLASANRIEIRMRGLYRKAVVGVLILLGMLFVIIHVRGSIDRIESDKRLFLGREAVRQRKESAAIEELSQSVALNPNNMVARLELAIARLRAGRFEEAVAQVHLIREKTPDYPKTYLMESLGLLQLGEVQGAERAITEEIRQRNHPESYYAQSLVRAHLGDSAGVRNSLERVVEQNIAAGSQIHLENACRALGEYARTETEIIRLEVLLTKAMVIPDAGFLAEILQEVRRRRGGE